MNMCIVTHNNDVSHYLLTRLLFTTQCAYLYSIIMSMSEIHDVYIIILGRSSSLGLRNTIRSINVYNIYEVEQSL
jgi:hypothetical protein